MNSKSKSDIEHKSSRHQSGTTCLIRAKSLIGNEEHNEPDEKNMANSCGASIDAQLHEEQHSPLAKNHPQQKCLIDDREQSYPDHIKQRCLSE